MNDIKSEKNLEKRIWYRLLKVIYALFLLIGLLFIFITYSSSEPYSYTTYSYKAHCANGKIFDPTSKPIDHSFSEPYGFDEEQIKSECEFGNAWSYWSGIDNAKYKLTYQAYLNVVRTENDQIKITLIAGAAYYLILEIIRRTILYIFVGKSFISLKRNRHNKP